jgi:uncharacterized membrane protein YidH (DUF202 family)
VGYVEKFDKWLRRFALYDALRFSSKGDWGRAVAELFITLLFGTLPVWLPLVVFPMFGKAFGSWTEIVFDQVKNGELYIIAAALMAPVFYFTFPNARAAGESKATRSFPSQQLIILIFIVGIIIAVLAIAATKVQTTASVAPGRLPIPLRMIQLSAWIFAFYALLYFFTLVVRNWLDRGGVERTLDEASQRLDQEIPRSDAAHQSDPVSADQLVADTLRAAEQAA